MKDLTYTVLTLATYEKALNDGRLVLPAGLLLLDVSKESVIENIQKREDSGGFLVPKFYKGNTFLEDLKFAYDKLFDRIPTKK